MKTLTAFMAATALLGMSACNVNLEEEDNAAEGDATNQSQQDPQQAQRQAQLQQMRDQGRQEFQNLRFVVDISDREVRVFNGDQQIRTEQVAVGTSEHPTPTGSWNIHQVDINPEWIPPDSEWAEDEERQPPGAAENPMGRARLIFNSPYTIHGTDEMDSLGQAASHGSIRVANPVVVELAEAVLKAGGAWEGDQWFQQRINNRSEEYQIQLEDPVPIEVQD